LDFTETPKVAADEVEGEEQAEEEQQRMMLDSKVDLSTQVPIGMLMEVTLREPERSSRISHVHSHAAEEGNMHGARLCMGLSTRGCC
jgi:hypothetical protein